MTLHLVGFIILKVLSVLIFGVIIFKVIMLIKKKSLQMEEKYKIVRKSNAINILKERFASGEIDDNEYKERSAFLSSLNS